MSPCDRHVWLAMPAERAPEFDHLALGVDLDEPWLADVGFGQSILEPLRMQVGVEHTDPVGTFRRVKLEDRFQLEKREADGTRKRQYSFSLQPRQLEQFAGMCHYHQTSPESSFTQKRICTRATLEGRITVANLNLILTRNGRREEAMLASEQEGKNILRDQFGVVL